MQYIKDVVIDLSATASDAARFGRDIYNYEKRIAEVTPEAVVLQDVTRTRKTFKVSQLNDIAPSVSNSKTKT